MILRIEDTDQNRYVSNAESYIIESLNWCGIQFDEDPIKGGPYGPYRQSERKGLYRQYAETLVSRGFAYYAFDSELELEEMRDRLKHEDPSMAQYGPFTRLSMKNSLTLLAEVVQEKLSNCEPFVIRIKIPEKEDIIVHDLIRGEVVVHSHNLDDKVLFKSDGWPTYHLANIVDDHLMKISHVIRGEEWLPSAPLHVLLYRYLGWEAEMPAFAHLPLLLKPDGNGKLSKRDGDRLGFPVFPLQWEDLITREISSGYRESGYLPEAFINILAFLGWNPGTEKELFSMDELIEEFSLERVGRHGSKFDPEKAKWFNHHYIQRMAPEELSLLLTSQIVKHCLTTDPIYTARVCSLIRDRVTLIPDLWNNAWFFFKRPETYNEQVKQKIWKPETTQLVKGFAEEAGRLDVWNKEQLHGLVENYLFSMNAKMGQLMNPLRLLIIGDNQGPGMMETEELLGKEEVLARIRIGMEKING